MKAFSLLVACCLLFCSTLLMRASAFDTPAEEQSPHGRAEPSHQVGDCGGEPCDAVARGFRAFFDRRLEELGGNGRACADCHMATERSRR